MVGLVVIMAMAFPVARVERADATSTARHDTPSCPTSTASRPGEHNDQADERHRHPVGSGGFGRSVVAAKSVAAKARVMPGTTIAVLNPVPAFVDSWGLPGDVAFVPPRKAQLVLLFVISRAELESRMPRAGAALGATAALVFFRKGSETAKLDMNRDDVWAMPTHWT
jgi:hypothetical protein